MSGEGERASRPNSLLLEPPPPEREPLHFDVQLVGAPPEVEQLVNNIKQVAEDFLYHWKTFPIVLPPSQFTGPGNKPSDIIIAPPCDELDAAALDAGVEPQPLSPKQLHAIREKGLHKDKVFNPKKLSTKQLESIHEWGEFEVPSRHFPGQSHVWRVAGWLQRGRARAREELYCHVARAVALLVVVARDRLLRDEPLSVIGGGKALLQGLHRLLDVLIGMPSLEARDLDKKIREERSRYLVAELICKPEDQEDITALAAWVSRAMRRAASEKTDARDALRLAPRVPCVYTTPQKTQVDLRLYRREVARRAAGPLQALLERESRGWFLHFRERRAAHLASQKVPIKDIEEEVRVAALREYVTRVCSAVLASEPLRALGDGVPDLLAAQLRAAVLMDRAKEGVQRKLEAGLARAEARILATHPVLSRAGAWRAERLAAASRRLRADLSWAPLEDAAAAMQAQQLHQHRYFLLRDLAFLRDREPLLLKELRAAKTPTREFTWATRIWLPRNWSVVRHFRGRSERIPTVLSTRATSIVTPRSDPSQPVFLVHRERLRRTATRWPAWRLLNLAHRTWCWGWNMMFLLGVLVPWYSPVSLRALLQVKPFVTDYELSQVNGTLFPKRSSETQTMWSRLLRLWRHVSKERTRFETEPDTGLLGKGMSRQANRLWNYGVVGGLGSLALLLAFPICAVLCCLLSLCAALTVPLWMPALTLAVHASNALVYDLDCPAPKLNRYFVLLEIVVWHIGLLGVLQPLAALLVAVVLCPLGALLLLVGGVSWWAGRGVWEAAAWRAVIVRAARVPAHDSAFCKRVAGPGLHTRACYQITAAQALAAVCARAELEALAEWAAEIESVIERPLRDYAHFVDACFGPFSVQIAKTGAYKQLEKECNELVMSVREKLAARRRDLALGLTEAARARVRMTAPDLRKAVQASAHELSRAWAGRGEEWWSARGLEPADWHALAANTLVEVFDAEILVALEEGEARLSLEGGEAARAWAARCGRGLAPPDVLAERDHWRRDPHEPHPHGVWGEWSGTPAPRVPPPSLEVSAFSPRAPLQPPVPHPAAVALVLHNRESDNPVPLDSELCADILRTLEDAPDIDDRRDLEKCGSEVERYRGGGSSASSSASGSASSAPSSAGSPDEDRADCAHDTALCRISGSRERAACRWTLTGRGVRLRADLASPEDVTLDTDRHVGTSV
ncbi:hypothetical protein RR46_09801 [Papilio xuthus]|uniref:Uncharacterized protein n=1 Tax=Papilio xuthus TaxID=66420 RepID=A0A194QAN7_PAPXU|nr:hypothetical protein RR46_09801 [Papilio xuthus]